MTEESQRCASEEGQRPSEAEARFSPESPTGSHTASESAGKGSAASVLKSTERWQTEEQRPPQSNVLPTEKPSRRRWLSRIGLHRRISLFVGLGLTICLITFGMLGLQSVTDATQHELNERLLVVRMAAGQIDRTLLSTLRSLEVAAATSGIDPANGPSETNRRLLRGLHSQTDLSALRFSLLGPDGVVVLTEPDDPSLVGQNLMGDAYIGSVYRAGKSSISGLRNDSDRHTVSLTAPILDSGGRIVGALSGDFDLSDPSLMGFLQPLQLGETGNVQVIDDQGNVLGSASYSDWADKPIDHRRFAELIQRGVPTVGVCHDCHVGAAGLERRQDVMAFAPLANAPLGIVMRQSADEAFAASHDLQAKMVAFGIFLLIAGLVLAQLTTRGVVKPIEVLTRAAQRIAKGDLESPVAVVGHSEIAVLRDALEEMRDRLRDSLDEIERWNESLENRVLQRTRELSALLQLANTLTSTLDLDTLLAFILTRAAETFKAADAGALMLHDRGLDQLVVRSSVGYQPAPLRRLRLRPGEGIAGKVFASGREALCTSREELDGALANMSEANRRQLEQANAGLARGASCICAPLVSNDRAMGSLFLMSPEPSAFTASDLRLLRAMADQAAVAVENAQLYHEVRRSEEVRGSLLAKLIGVQEEERRRIARELHDETSQALTALVMSLAQLRKVTPGSLPAVHNTIDEIENLAELTLDDIHRLIYDLRPTVLDDLGLVPAIQWYIETYAQKAGIEIDLQVDDMDERLSPQVETVLFRIIQEAVTNIVRHAEASMATVRLRRREGQVVAVIEDDGKGFDSRGIAKKSGQRGLGILGMKERVNLLGGRLSIASRPGRGTKLSIEVPVASGDREYDSSIASR